MFKLFLIILLTLFLWMVLQLVISAFRVAAFFKSGLRNQSRAPAQPQNTMVKCSVCDLYVLDNEAIIRNGTYYCSLDHAKSPN
jgi:hypothetical protein